MNLPLEHELNPHLKSYIEVDTEVNFLNLLEENTEEANLFFKSIPFEKHNYKYAPEKWTIKEILQHIIDTERVFANRAFVASRLDADTNLQSFDENEYARNVEVSHRSMSNLLDEFNAFRKATYFLYENMNEQQRSFKAKNGDFKVTAKAIGFVMLGHLNHHIRIIKERYLF